MSSYNNVNRVLIGDGTNSGTITSIAGIQKGDLFLLNEAGVPVTTNAAAAALPRHERVTIAAGIGNGIAILSSPIQGHTVSKYEGQSYVAPSERVVILGYNGTASTSISVTAGTEYRLRILIKDSHRFNGQRSTLGDVNYLAPTGGTLAEAAAAIAKLYDETDYGHNYLSDKVKLERVSNGTRTVFPNTADVVNGSKTVSLTAHALTVGTPIRLDVAAHSASSPVYVIEEVIDANTFKIDVAYKGATGTIALANSGSMTAVTEWGFKLTGIAQDSYISNAANEPLDEYEWINFDAVFSEANDPAAASAATFTESTALNPGQGYWKQVADREEAAKGYLGDTSKRRFHDKRIVSNVVVDQAYDSVVITHADIHRGDFQDTYNAPLKTEIYIPEGSTQATNSGNNFLHVLNGFFSSVVGFTAITL